MHENVNYINVSKAFFLIDIREYISPVTDIEEWLKFPILFLNLLHFKLAKIHSYASSHENACFLYRDYLKLTLDQLAFYIKDLFAC